MSQENPGTPDAPDSKVLDDTKVQEKKDELRKLLESKRFPDILKTTFQVIKDKDSRLLSDALDAIRQIATENASLLDEANLQLIVDLLHNDDDILRASAVLALKPVILSRPDSLYQLLTTAITTATSKNGREEAIRLLGFLGADHPEKIEKLIPEIVGCLADDNVHVRKRSQEVLMILAKTAPGKIEKELKKMAGKITDTEVLAGINEIITEAIKKRELKGIDEKITAAEQKVDLIPDVPPQPEHEEVATPAQGATAPGVQAHEQPTLSEKAIQQEIGAKIEAEFSKIDEGTKPATSELKELKEIKTAQDLVHPPASVQVVAKLPEQAPPVAVPVEAILQKQARSPESNDNIVKKQLELKEKELQRREEELKKLELEKKELELEAKELEMQREELKKAKLEQMELEVKRKEEELKRKELELKLKELEDREKKLKEIEKTFQKDE